MDSAAKKKKKKIQKLGMRKTSHYNYWDMSQNFLSFLISSFTSQKTVGKLLAKQIFFLPLKTPENNNYFFQ